MIQTLWHPVLALPEQLLPCHAEQDSPSSDPHGLHGRCISPPVKCSISRHCNLVLAPKIRRALITADPAVAVTARDG
jgi:hypothetical protein